MTVVNPKSISGINSITMASGSDDLLTIHSNNTTERVRVNSSGDVIVGSGVTLSPDGDIFATGITTVSGNVKVGTGITLSPDGDVFFTGIITGNGSGLTNLATDLVNDTSPQLGGDLDTNSHHILVDDDHQIRFGDSNDFNIQHNTNENYIQSNSGHIYIRANVDDDEGDNIYIQAKSGEDSIVAHDDGAVELYHDGTKQCETSANGLAFPSGKGLDFNATSDQSGATSEIFDDYEEGQWTPNIKGTSGAGTASYGTQSGRYTKVGNFVHITFELNWSSGSAGGELRVTDLPFSPTTDYEGIGNAMFHSVYLHGNEGNCVYVGPGTNYTYFYQSRSDNSWHTVNYDSAGIVIGNVSFRTA